MYKNAQSQIKNCSDISYLVVKGTWFRKNTKHPNPKPIFLVFFRNQVPFETKPHIYINNIIHGKLPVFIY